MYWNTSNPPNPADLINDYVAEREKIPVGRFQTLVESFPRKVKACSHTFGRSLRFEYNDDRRTVRKDTNKEEADFKGSLYVSLSSTV